MPLSLTIGEGTEIADKLGVGLDRKKEIVVYVNNMIKEHTKGNMSVPDTIYEITIDPFFKSDAELAIGIFIVGSVRGLTVGAQPSSEALKLNAIKLLRRDLVDFLHFLGDRDGVIHVLAGYVAEEFAREGMQVDVFDKIQKVSEEASDIILKKTDNDGERILILCAMMSVLISSMTNRADRLSLLKDTIMGMMKDGRTKDS